MTEYRPPAAAEFVAGAMMPDDDLRDGFLGDLAEEYGGIASNESVSAANRWYWLQLARSVGPLSLMSIVRRGPMGGVRFVGSVIVGLAVMWTIIVALFVGLVELFVLANGGDGYRGAMALGQSLTLLLVWTVSSGIIGSVAAGFVAVLIDRQSAIASAVVLGIATGSTLVLETRGSPRNWFLVMMFVIAFWSVVAGALLRLRRKQVMRCA